VHRLEGCLGINGGERLLHDVLQQLQQDCYTRAAEALRNDTRDKTARGFMQKSGMRMRLKYDGQTCCACCCVKAVWRVTCDV